MTETVRPPLPCHRHQASVVRLEGPTGEWQMLLLLYQIATMHYMLEDERVVQRSEGDPSALNLVLAEIGCGACWLGEEMHARCRDEAHDELKRARSDRLPVARWAIAIRRPEL